MELINNQSTIRLTYVAERLLYVWSRASFTIFYVHTSISETCSHLPPAGTYTLLQTALVASSPCRHQRIRFSPEIYLHAEDSHAYRRAHEASITRSLLTMEAAKILSTLVFRGGCGRSFCQTCDRLSSHRAEVSYVVLSGLGSVPKVTGHVYLRVKR